MFSTFFPLPSHHVRPSVEAPLLKATRVPSFIASTTRERTRRSCFEYSVEEVIDSQVYIYYNLLYYALGM